MGVPGGGAFHHCEGRLVLGAVPPPAARPLERVAGVPRPVCPVCRRRGRGDPHGPHSVRRCGPALLAVGVAEGCPQGGRLPPLCEERLRSGAVPPPTARLLGGLLGSATHVLWARGCGCGGLTLSLWPECPVGAACRGGGGGLSPGGWPATVARGAWCQALSLPRPPVLWSGQPGFRDPCVPGAVGAGVGTQHRSHSVRPCGPALLAVGVVEGRPPGGCLPLLWGAPGVRRCPSPGRPPSGVGSQGSATRCPGCGRCGRGDPAPAPQRAPLRAGIARCGGGGRASPGGCLSPL